jgi:hypothetical protein
MDPYLEDPVRWTGVHHIFITFIGTTLNTLLPARYVARVQERLYVVEPDREIYPDVWLQKQSGKPSRGRGGGATAVAQECDPYLEIEVGPEEVQEGFVEIVPVADQVQVVTTIEVLSPTNKLAGTEGRHLYRTKQREVLAGPAHLLEIDLLRQGKHTVASPPPDRLARRGPYDYLVCLSRSDQRGCCQIWKFTLRQRLPRVLVPLAGDDPDVVLDLQTVFNRVYDEGRYAQQLNYRLDPTVPLTALDARWAGALLCEKGLRTKKRHKKNP